MSGKLFARLLISSATILGRALSSAYKQAIVNAAKPNQGASSKSNSGYSVTGMQLDEALKILNVKDDANIEEIEKRYQHLYKVNDKSVNGSFYLQAKVVRAKQRILLERGIDLKSYQEQIKSIEKPQS